ncbi:MAG: VTT domain-containing protein [Gemmatimonadaceae bacterium]
MTAAFRSARSRRIGIALAVVAIALLIAWRSGLFALHDRVVLAAAVERARTVPYVAPLFVAVYGLGGAFGVPVTPLTIAGGALFGAWPGIALNWTGEMLAATIAFAVARAAGLRKREEDIPIGSTPPKKSAALATLFRLRLIPIAPFSLLNAGAAMSQVSWRDYLIATGVGIIPITVIYTVSASELMSDATGSSARALKSAGISAVVLILLTLLPSLVRRMRKQRRIDPGATGQQL